VKRFGDNRPAWTGYGVAALVLLLTLTPLGALFSGTSSLSSLAIWQDPWVMRSLQFSLWQAGLSTLISVAPAVVVARAFARHPVFPGRRLLLAMFGLPLVVPAIVAVLGVISVFGASGWLPLGRGLYGLGGILIAHVFFNLPLATRLLLPSLERIPTAQWRLADQFGFNQWQRWRLIEWPALRASLWGTTLLVFMLCLTSFAVVLSLGGGPRSTTLEVAIYQSLRFDFDPGRAALLALLQLSLCAALAVVLAMASGRYATESDLRLRPTDRTGDNIPGSGVDVMVVAASGLFVGAILLAIIIDGLAGPVLEVISEPRFWQAAGISLFIALCASLLSLALGWTIVRGAALEAWRGRERMAHLLETIGMMVYIVPPLVLGTGLFLLFIGTLPVDRLTLPVVIGVNTLMGLPFVVRSLQSAVRQRTAEYELLCQSLGIRGINRLGRVDLPLLRRQLGLAAALTAALGFGDLGVITLFSSGEFVTLPLLLYQRLSSYQVPEASVLALLLLGACLCLFVLIERLLGGPRHA